MDLKPSLGDGSLLNHLFENDMHQPHKQASFSSSSGFSPTVTVIREVTVLEQTPVITPAAELRRRQNDACQQASQSADQAARQASQSASQSIQQAQQSASEAVRQASQSASQAIQQAQSSVSQSISAASRSAASAQSSASQVVASIQSSASVAISNANESMNNAQASASTAQVCRSLMLKCARTIETIEIEADICF